ncbi:PEP-utilizing enzyme [Gordonia sputi]|uniref:PEP-utilizing enzyme n=1 Tax=Gordonia sputi TaxID=36823 RepID=UPI0036CF5EAC
MTTHEPVVADPATFETVGKGLTVYESDDLVVGRAKWLETPGDVISFVESGEDVSDVIVIARGGTTTFLAMALNAGVRGVITLQGAPESHLGILSREYGIPCIMSVVFERGVRTGRGETIPADGVQLKLDISSRPDGIVSVEPGAPVDDSPVDADTGGGMSPEQMAQIQALLAKFQGEVPPGLEGDAIMRKRLGSNVLDLDDPEFDRELSIDETNDVLHYLAWNEWDALAARATEGESGLIPRQEYEAMGIMDSWFHHPLWLKAIQDRVGPEGMTEIAARAKNEIGTKINLLHIWACASASSFGRGIALELKLHDFDYRTSVLPAAMSTVRRMYKGIWGTGPMFSSMRDYRAPILDSAWIDRFSSDRIEITGDAERSTFQRFNGALELLGFLVHFDNRLGLGDSGPYPTEDGGFVLVRDLFINEPAYEWSSTTEGLPYAVTIAMKFDADSGLKVRVQDLSTMFSDPANYLPHVKGVSVYARDKWDTPMSDVRVLSLADMDDMRARGEASSEALYKHIASMSQEEKVMAGAVVYASGFVLPFARAAGMVDELIADHGFMSVHPVPTASYETIISGVAGEMIPRLFLTGTWANDVTQASGDTVVSAEREFEVLHATRVRGFATAEQIATSTGLEISLIEQCLTEAVEAGFVKQLTGRISGARLTPAGRARLLLLTQKEVGETEKTGLSCAYDAFLAPNREFKALTTQWQSDKDLDAVLAGLDRIHGEVNRIVGDASAASARFGNYRGRFDDALARFRDGDESALARPMSESYHDIWMELHEDLLATLGRQRGDHDE